MSSGAQITVNSFWHGAPLPLNSWLCLKSFIDHGVGVVLYCYDDVTVPPGVVVRDARQVLPHARLFTYRTGAAIGSVSAFSNLFRYKLLLEKGGWWIDVDVLCLRPALPSQKLVFGWENDRALGTAVLKFPRGHWLAEKLYLTTEAIIQDRGKSLQWGEIGPGLLTHFVKKYDLFDAASPSALFYPIGYHEIDLLLCPEQREKVQQRAEQSVFLHLWQEMFRRAGIDPRSPPPVGSYLAAMFARHSLDHARSIDIPIEISLSDQHPREIGNPEQCSDEVHNIPAAENGSTGEEQQVAEHDVSAIESDTSASAFEGKLASDEYTIAILEGRLAEREHELADVRDAVEKAHDELRKHGVALADYERLFAEKDSATRQAELALTDTRGHIEKRDEVITLRDARITDLETQLTRNRRNSSMYGALLTRQVENSQSIRLR